MKNIDSPFSILKFTHCENQAKGVCYIDGHMAKGIIHAPLKSEVFFQIFSIYSQKLSDRRFSTLLFTFRFEIHIELGFVYGMR